MAHFTLVRKYAYAIIHFEDFVYKAITNGKIRTKRIKNIFLLVFRVQNNFMEILVEECRW